MSIRDEYEQLDTDVAGLGVYDADPALVERIRSRCLTRLAARGRRSAAFGTGLLIRRLESAVACGIGAVYFAAAFLGSLALYWR